MEFKVTMCYVGPESYKQKQKEQSNETKMTLQKKVYTKLIYKRRYTKLIYQRNTRSLLQPKQNKRSLLGWIFRLVIDTTFFAFLFIDHRRLFAFNSFYLPSPFLCFLLTCYRLVKSL